MKRKLLLEITKKQLYQLKEQDYLSEKGLKLLQDIEEWDKEDEITDEEKEVWARMHRKGKEK